MTNTEVMKIFYICPMLGERVLITFSQESQDKELARLKKLKYKIINNPHIYPEYF